VAIFLHDSRPKWPVWRSALVYSFTCKRRRKGSQLFGSQLFKRSSIALQSRLESQCDFVELGRVDHVCQFGQLDWVEVAQTLPSPVKFSFHPECSLEQFGMRLGGAAKDQGLIASGQTLLVVTVVETKSDQGGAEAARSWNGLLHQAHRAVDLSRVGCRNRWRTERCLLRTARSAVLVTRLSYRFLFSQQTARTVGIAAARQT
jgi:hypothetical protein